jgi:hypothetical protein
VDFIKFNATTKKDPYMLPFTNEVINIVARHEVYTFLDGSSRYHQISITPEDKYITTFVTNWGAFIWVVMLLGSKKDHPFIKGQSPKLSMNTLMCSWRSF